MASITLCHGPVISTTPHSVTTPTVCGHAEACPSTTYGKSKLARGPFTRATFWLGGRKFFFHQNLCHWGRGPGWPVVRDSFLPNPDGKNAISETSRQNLLKFCIRLPMTILRTNPYWHFAQKTQKVGQNLSFLVKKWRFFEKIFFQRQLLVTGSPSAITPSWFIVGHFMRSAYTNFRPNRIKVDWEITENLRHFFGNFWNPSLSLPFFAQIFFLTLS